MKTLYTTKVTTRGGRDGVATSDDGYLNIALTTPKEMGGRGGEKTNPEQLFAAGYSACFENALRHMGRDKGWDTSDAVVTASVGFSTNGKPNALLVLALVVSLDVTLPSLAQSDAIWLTNEAHRVCPYSCAIRGNIDVPITVNGVDLQAV